MPEPLLRCPCCPCPSRPFRPPPALRSLAFVSLLLLPVPCPPPPRPLLSCLHLAQPPLPPPPAKKWSVLRAPAHARDVLVPAQPPCCLAVRNGCFKGSSACPNLLFAALAALHPHPPPRPLPPCFPLPAQSPPPPPA